MEHGNGMKDREDKSRGIEILITESFVKKIWSMKYQKKFLRYFIDQNQYFTGWVIGSELFK
jgi:hypothetical protein